MLALHCALALWAHQILEGLTPKPGLRWGDLKLSSLLPSQTRVPKRRHARLQRRRSHRERGILSLHNFIHYHTGAITVNALEPQNHKPIVRGRGRLDGRLLNDPKSPLPLGTCFPKQPWPFCLRSTSCSTKGHRTFAKSPAHHAFWNFW